MKTNARNGIKQNKLTRLNPPHLPSSNCKKTKRIDRFLSSQETEG